MAKVPVFRASSATLATIDKSRTSRLHINLCEREILPLLRNGCLQCSLSFLNGLDESKRCTNYLCSF